MLKLLGPLSHQTGQSPLHAVSAHGKSRGVRILLIKVVQYLAARAIEFYVGERIPETPLSLHEVAPAAYPLDLYAPAAELCRDHDFDELKEREPEGSL